MSSGGRPSKAAWRWILLGGAGIGLAGAGIGSEPSASAQQPVAEAALPPAPTPAPVWSASAARDLVKAIDHAMDEGLNPDDYGRTALKAALDAGPGPALDDAARASAMMLAHDYQFGRITDRADLGWHIDRGASSGIAPAFLDQAAGRGEVRRYLESLLPTDARYKALRAALADAADPATRDRIRANMERWRWMPRNLGEDYLYVNVPTYRLQVVEGDKVSASYTVVVGAKDTPTPWIAGDAPSVVVNPWWNVPQSIVKSSNLRPGRGGYVFKASANGGWQVRQPPGPRNALGRLKINLTNDQAIYLHDTPAKGGFVKDERALSHGCIRVKNIDQLAEQLMSDGAPEDGRLQEALAGTDTRTLQLPRRWPVYLVYFTMDRNEQGDLVSYGDPYGRDAEVIARLDGRPSTTPLKAAMQIAAN